MDKVYGFIGSGNMGSALIRSAAKTVDPKQILICDTDMNKVRALEESLFVQGTDIGTIAEKASYIFLGVKPQMMEEMLSGIRETLKARKDRFVLISMAAGLSMDKIRSFAGDDYPVIRIMPNLAASVGEGMILYTSAGTEKEEIREFLYVMQEAGEFAELKEELIDAGSAVSGCGPAFAALFAEAMADALVKLGLKRDQAYLLSAQTLKGTASLLLQDGLHPAVLKDAVCSPGGTTIAGVTSLEKDGFRAACENAVEAAYRRTLELR